MSTESDEHIATAAELKALAHPLRMRMLRLCLHESMTNKQLADHLDLDPATALHHVRTLARNGFLIVEPARTGPKGALEKPYRASNKSWRLSIPRPDDRMSAVLAGLDATRDELIAAGPDSLITQTRLGLRLTSAEIDELTDRIDALVREFADRVPTADGVKVGWITLLHRLA